MARSVIGVPRTTAGNRQVVRDFGTCLNFAPTSSRVIKSSFSGALASNATQSISFWMKPGTTVFNTTVFTYENSGAGSAIGLGFSSATPSTIFFQNWGGGVLVTTATKLVSGNWYHIAYTFNGTTDRVYVNGALDNSNNGSHQTSTPNTLIFGNYSGLSNPYFKGKLDDIRIYNRLLSAPEITNLYNGVEPDSTNFFLQWKFDEGSGSTANDSKGSNNGTITNATYSSDVVMVPRTAAPEPGTALDFGGDGDRVNITSVAAQNNLTTLSLSLWCRPRANGSYNMMINKGSDNWFIGYDSSWGLVFGSKWSGAGARWSVANLSLDALHHVVVTYDGSSSSNVPIFYVDNVVKSVTTRTAASGSLSADTTTLTLGNDNANNGYARYDGMLDEIRIYDRVITRAEAETLYTKQDVASGLVGHYKLDEGSGTTAIDTTGNANGIITGATYVRGIFGRQVVT